LVWKFVEGTVSMCNLSGTEGEAKEKEVQLWGLEVHTSGWVKFVYWCWVRSPYINFYIGVCLRLWFFYFDFVWFWGCLWWW
jgi:hypothetical protein